MPERSHRIAYEPPPDQPVPISPEELLRRGSSLVLAAGLSAMTGIGFGLAPALQGFAG